MLAPPSLMTESRRMTVSFSSQVALSPQPALPDIHTLWWWSGGQSYMVDNTSHISKQLSAVKVLTRAMNQLS